MPHAARYNPRWVVAEQIAAAVRGRFAAEVQAIGVCGSLAHGDDTDANEVEVVVVTRRGGTGPRPCTRRIDGIIVDLGVVGADEYLRHARALTTSWPLTADRYLTVKTLHDPDRWYARLRDTHLARLAAATAREFGVLGRESWCRAATAHAKARRLAEWYDTDTALLLLSEARLAVALVDGLLSRTYFRSREDAVRKAGVASADLTELAERLAAQSTELTQRGQPVDASIADLF